MLRVSFLATSIASLIALMTAPGAEARTPAESLAAFRSGDPSLRVQLVASEPLVESPCAFAFDERGRMFVAENRGYPNVSEPAQGRIALLTDQDGDGRMDERTTFADGLTYPNGVLPWRGGVIVTCAPDVLYLRDVDGDGRADEKQVLLTGFATTGSTQLRVNAPTLGLDGWIYLAAGLSGGMITAPSHPERPPLKMTADLRFHPDTLEVENSDGRSQFGQSFDDYGRRFICMNRLPVQHVVMPTRWLRRNPQLTFTEAVQDCHERDVKTALKGGGDGVRLFPISNNVTTADSHAGSFSAACGVFVWTGGALPEAFRGNVLSCDPTGNLVHMDRLEPRGATFVAKPAFEKHEFLSSKDDWFRPVYLGSGPNGALYIADMYRAVIEHPDYLPAEVRKRTDFETGKSMGRIWRVSSKPEAKFDAASITGGAAQVKALAHENSWHRTTAFRLLCEKTVSTETLKAALPGNTPAAQSAILHLLAQRSGLDSESLQMGANASDPEVREVGLRLWLEHHQAQWWMPDPAVLGNEPNARARFIAALTLGDIPEGVSALAAIAAKDARDRWTRAAALSGIAGREADFLTAFLHELKSIGEGEVEILRGVGRSFPDLKSLRKALATIEGEREFTGPLMLTAKMGLLLGSAERNNTRLSAAEDDEWLQGIFADASAAARETQGEIAKRRLGIALLGRMNWEAAGNTLLEVAVKEPNEALREAAVRAAASFPQDEVAEELLASGHWENSTPAQREMILEALLGGGVHAGGVLDAIEAKRLPANAIPALRRTALLKHKDPSIRSRAEKVFGSVDGDRKAAFESRKPALTMHGNPAHGRELFQQSCTICHRLDRAGHAVGPDLLDIRNQPKENILFHIVIPDAEIAPAFAAYIAETNDGRTVSGVLTSETPTSVTLRGPLAQETSVLRAELKSLQAMANSLMPTGLEQAMTLQDLADLLAYLKGE